MERNIRLYPLYQAFWNALFWMPVFFLLFASVLTPAEVLRLEAIYYLAVVLFEVPSGYLSDRVGRRVTLLIATACWTGAGVVFALADSFGTFVVAQILLAGGMAFNSGTDTSLLYDSLAVLGRHDEMAQVESRAASAGLYAGSIAALFGGLAGMFSLRLGYVLSSLAATGAMLVVWRFGEPPAGDAQVLPPASQVVDCLRRLRNPALAWLFLFAVAMTVFDHVPYEFAQPWLGFLIVSAGGSARLTPMSSGVIVAVVALLGALAAGRAVWLRSRLGIRPALMVLMLLQVGVTTLGQWIHPLVLIALALRGVPDAVAGPIRNAAVHAHLHSGIRATWLSLQSLAGRLAFSGTLAIGSLFAGSGVALTPDRLSTLLVGFATAGGLTAVTMGGLAFIRWRRREPEGTA